jgi:hypothetical protein
MTNIYDLNEQQQRIQDELFWLDTEETTEREFLEQQLAQVQGDAKRKISFFSTLLADSMRTEEAMEEAARRTRERLASQRRKTDALKTLIGDMMDNFQIKKVVGDYVNVTRTAGRDSVVLNQGHDVTELPDDLIKTKVTTDIDKKKVIELYKEGKPLPEAIAIVKKPGLLVK